MNTYPDALLIPSCVHVSAPFVKVVAAADRLRLTLEALAHWVSALDEMGADIPIVICDGSGYDFGPAVAERFPHTRIECLAFLNDRASVEAFGKGYGEGEILLHALDHSAVMKGAKSFIKCTAKLWVSNLRTVMEDWNGALRCDCRFEMGGLRARARASYFDTRFYVISKALYIDCFGSAHEGVRDYDGHWLEHCFAEAMFREGLLISDVLFPRAPLIEGVSGSIGCVYRPVPPSVARRLKRFLRRRVVGVKERVIDRTSARLLRLSSGAPAWP